MQADSLIGKVVSISGMAIEILSDEGERWRCRNLTTKATLHLEKTIIENAIKLGKAEILNVTE